MIEHSLNGVSRSDKFFLYIVKKVRMYLVSWKVSDGIWGQMEGWCGYGFWLSAVSLRLELLGVPKLGSVSTWRGHKDRKIKTCPNNIKQNWTVQFIVALQILPYDNHFSSQVSSSRSLKWNARHLLEEFYELKEDYNYRSGMMDDADAITFGIIFFKVKCVISAPLATPEMQK